MSKCSENEQVKRRLKRRQTDIKPRFFDLKSNEVGFPLACMKRKHYCLSFL
jgi:hypothetical protein